jgi:CubicO group peptidase (beta-lactamase class C family)
MSKHRVTRGQHGRALGGVAALSAIFQLAACGPEVAGPDQDVTRTSASLTTGRPGDINFDSRSDIALTGGIGWGSLPVAFSNGDGSFLVTNLGINNFAIFAAQPGALPVTGDFNGDGRTDVALTAGFIPGTTSPWNTIPVAFSNGDGTFTVTNKTVLNFPTYATQGPVKPVAGDFNGDGLWDIALTGGYIPGTLTPWSTIPVAFSNGDGTFHVTNMAATNFPAYAINDGAKAVAGDFNGDGRADIALTGGLIAGTSTPWSTVPVAFSNGDGTFNVTNRAVASFPIFATQHGAMPVSGDFNGDGRGDIALTGGFIPGTTSPWNTVPVAFSNGDGTFAVTNMNVASFPTFATQTGAKPVGGDFNGDGRGDIALTGGIGWGSVPVAFSNGDGTFAVTNKSVANFPTFATQPGAKPAGAWSSDGNFGDPARFASKVYANIAAHIKGKVVGYGAAVGGAANVGVGQARTAADAPAQSFLSSTKIPVASVSKVVTALAAIRILAKHGISLDAGIGGHLPSDWVLDPNVAAITFRQLLSHRSGIKDYGNVSQDYASLKTFFTQKVDTTKNSVCTGPATINPPNPFNTIDRSPCYSNWNFAIFRVLLPVIDGFVDNPANRAAVLAATYIKIVQTNVFEPVGAIGVDAKPPTSGPQSTAYAFSYAFPGTSGGFNWGDDTLGVGAAGWYLAVDDIAKVLTSLSNNDGKVLTSAQIDDMETTPLGWDVLKDGAGYRWVEKNGGWGANGTTISTSIALFGPGVIGALFMNSEISGEPGVGAANVLHDAYITALTTPAP